VQRPQRTALSFSRKLAMATLCLARCGSLVTAFVLCLATLALPTDLPAQETCPLSAASDSVEIGEDGEEEVATGQSSCPIQRAPPSVSTGPHNGSNRNMRLCELGCFDAVVTHSTPGYVSLDTERSLTLVYTSAQARPMGFVQLDVWDDSVERPSRFSLRLRTAAGAWVTFTTGTQEIFWNRVGTNRLSALFDAAGLPTGAYAYTAVVRSWWSDGTFLETSAALRVLVLSEPGTANSAGYASVFGHGWQLAGWQQIFAQSDNTLVLREGDGSVLHFFQGGSCGTGCTNYWAPAGDFARLRRYSSYYERRYPDGMRAVFHLTGALNYLEDRFGNRTTWGYDAQGRLNQIQDPAGRNFTFTDSSGRISTITDPGGRVTRLTYDASGRLTKITDPDGVDAFHTTSYDTHGRLTGYRDRRGGQWNFSYDSAGKTATWTMPTVAADGATVRPQVTTRSWERASLPALGGSFSSPNSGVVESSIRAEITNPRGNTTKLALDRFGAATRVEEPLSRTTIIARDHRSLVTEITAPSGHKVDYRWDSNGNLIRVRDQTTTRKDTITYESIYNQPLVVSGDGLYVRNFYNTGALKLDSTKVGSTTAKATRYTWDSRGRVLSMTDPEGHTTTYRYLTTGFMNVDSVRAPGARRTQFTYDGWGRVSTVRDPIGWVTRIAYDALNRTTRTIGPISDTTRYTYDALYLTQVRDAVGQVYRFTPNALGWVVSDSSSLGGPRRTYTYDRNGNLRTARNRRAQTVSFSYDVLDRLTSRVADGRTTAYSYNAAGTLFTASNSESTDTIRYDVAGRLIEEVSRRGGNRYRIQSVYNSVRAKDSRRELRITPPGGTTRVRTYGYSAAQQLDTIVGFGRTLLLGYDGNRQLNLARIPLASPVIESTRYGSTLKPGLISYDNTTLNNVLGLRYKHDKLSRIEERRLAGRDTLRVFTYDGAGRLTRVEDFRETMQPGGCDWDPDEGFRCIPERTTRTPLGAATFAYDRVGNRTGSGITTSPGNRLTSFAGYSFTYDADGNVTRKSKTGFDQRYFWDSLGQLDSVRTNGATTRYGYDGLGRRVRKTVGSTTTRYAYDGDHFVLETDGAHAVRAEYIYYPGVDAPYAMQRGGIYFYTRDFPGSVMALLSEAGTVVNRYRYSAFGEAEFAQEGITNPLRFTGREYDSESALYFYRARYYDPQVGRFLSEDPIGLEGGINLYAYAGNDPVNKTDPFGLHTCEFKWNRKTATRDLVCTGGKRDRTDGRSKNFGNRRGSEFGPGIGSRSNAKGTRSTAQRILVDFRECASNTNSEAVENAVRGFKGGAIIGAAWGAYVGQRAGAGLGAPAGGVLGTTLGTPSILGAPIMGAVGASAGTLGGQFAGAWIGAHVGFWGGGAIGATTGYAYSFGKTGFELAFQGGAIQMLAGGYQCGS
jgi:RHS repeat-associated protein